MIGLPPIAWWNASSAKRSTVRAQLGARLGAGIVALADARAALEAAGASGAAGLWRMDMVYEATAAAACSAIALAERASQ